MSYRLMGDAVIPLVIGPRHALFVALPPGSIFRSRLEALGCALCPFLSDKELLRLLFWFLETEGDESAAVRLRLLARKPQISDDSACMRACKRKVSVCLEAFTACSG